MLRCSFSFTTHRPKRSHHFNQPERKRTKITTNEQKSQQPTLKVVRRHRHLLVATDPVKPLAQMNLEETKMQVTREEKTLNFRPKMKEFGSPLAIVGFGVPGHPRQLKVLHTKGPEKPTQALLTEPTAPKREALRQEPFKGTEEEKSPIFWPRIKEFGLPLAIVGFGVTGHPRQLKVLHYKPTAKPIQALSPEPAAPEAEAVCQKPDNGQEEEKSPNSGLKAEKFGELQKIVGVEESRQKRSRRTKQKKVHPPQVLVSEEPENPTKPPSLEPEKRPKDSSLAPQQTKRLSLGSLVDKFQEYKEKKDQKRKRKAEEQYARWTAFKSRYPGVLAQQQNSAYANGFDAGRKGILKSMF